MPRLNSLVRASLLMLSICLIFAVCSSSIAQEATGHWKGSWSSAESGHRGALRANIRVTPTGDYRAVFYGRFAAVVPFVYRTDLQPVTGQPGRYTSTKRLPILGEYRMDANVSASEFQARFAGRRDGGNFSMRRQ